MFSHKFSILFLLLPVILLFFICIFFIPILSDKYNFNVPSNYITVPTYSISSSGFCWPVPGYTTITSPYGYRTSPTYGASSFHAGIDIAANPGSYLVASLEGFISYVGFNGSGGYTIILENNTFTMMYCHVSPNFLVYPGQIVNQGQIIGQVGPKNVYGVPNNPYKDSNGNPTNGATTGPHLHFTLKKNSQAVNPLDYF